MRFNLLLILFIFIGKLVTAQQQSLDVASPGSTSSYGIVRYYDPGAIGNKNVEKVNYSDINGTPFWNENWNAGILILNNDKAVKLQNVKLNLYTNELLYKDLTGAELAAENSIVKKVIIFKGQDTTNVAGVFLSLADADNKNTYAYYRACNDGKLVLLQLSVITVRTSEYDPMSGKNEHSFLRKQSWYILNNGILTRLSSLSKASVNSIVASTPQAETWLSSHNNKLKNEMEIVSYFSYCNTLSK